MQHRRPEILEIGNILPGRLPDGAREINPAPLHDDVDIARGATQETVAHIAPDHEGANAPAGSYFADYLEDRSI